MNHRNEKDMKNGGSDVNFYECTPRFHSLNESQIRGKHWMKKHLMYFRFRDAIRIMRERENEEHGEFYGILVSM